jgi:hypothetical protein
MFRYEWRVLSVRSVHNRSSLCCEFSVPRTAAPTGQQIEGAVCSGTSGASCACAARKTEAIVEVPDVNRPRAILPGVGSVMPVLR